MNAHCPQSVEAATELREIAAVPLQIVSPRDSAPIVSVVQDTLVGANRFTRPDVLFTRREAMNLLVHAKRWDGTLPAPAVADPVPKWSGQQLLSALLPPISLQMPNSSYSEEDKKNPNSQNLVKIVNGQILQGILDSSVFSKQLIHVMYNDYGPELTVDFLDSLQAMIANFLMDSGFSVGISDLIADEGTNAEINEALKKITSSIEEQILQLHTGLFENSSGRTNQEEFEGKLMGALNKATSEAGKIGLKSLSSINRMTNMVKSGSKGSDTNVSQMIAALGQQAIEGKRVPNGFQHRTLPHYKRFDDSAKARGFIASSFIKGLNPDEFFFHAMSGREGLIDTAVKSVTGETEIVVLENGEPKWTQIGPWIDSLIDKAPAEKVEHMATANQELLNLEHPVYIPTCDADGVVTWGALTAVTRHDPGECLYAVTTESGREVTVAKSQSLLVWDSSAKQFLPKATPDVKPGDFLPVTMDLCDPPVVLKEVDMSKYLPKTEYLYGTDFFKAKDAIESCMEGRERCPPGWWEANNGKTFTLPYENKGRFQRVLNGRTDMSGVKEGMIYPFSHCREHPLPATFELNERNGIFVGLYLAEGNSDIPSGYVQISNNAPEVRKFVMDWFQDMGLECKERFRTVTLQRKSGGESISQSNSVRAFSKPLGIFLSRFLGSGSAGKFVPNEAFTAPKEFVRGLLNGYFSGDGSVETTGITALSVSKRLMYGISLLCSRLGIFGKIRSAHYTNHKDVAPEQILPTYHISIRSHWAAKFANEIPLLLKEKQEKVRKLKPTKEHINFPYHNNTVKDAVKSITRIVPDSDPKYSKLYDVTVPSTYNFQLFNCIQCRDTADTGYMQRQIRVALEDLISQHDGSVRDVTGNILQLRYGEDGINATKLENQMLPLADLSDAEMREVYATDGDAREEAYLQAAMTDRKMLVEGVFGSKMNKGVKYPVHLDRILRFGGIASAFRLAERTDASPSIVSAGEALDAQDQILERTHKDNRLWAALVRYYLAPRYLQKLQYTKVALDAVVEEVVVKHMKSWVEPGQPVGVIAAQSIGEPATQMSCAKDTTVCVTNGKDVRFYGPVKDFVDSILEQHKESVHIIGENSVVLPLEEDFFIVGVSHDEKTSWKRISEVSRHPANGGMVKVTTRTGRSTTATLSHSFLKRSKTGIVPVLGSDLKMGMRIPVARTIPEVPNALAEVIQGSTTFKQTKEFGWLCGAYLADGSLNGNTVRICKVHPVVEKKLAELAKEYDWPFSVHEYQGEYGPSKDNNILSKDLKDFLLREFGTGSFQKHIGAHVFHSNKEYIAGIIGGYFDGDGNVNVERQQIRASSRSQALIKGINALLGYVGIVGTMSTEKTVKQPGKVSYTLTVLKKFAQTFKEQVGFCLSEKAEALNHVIDYTARENKHSAQEMIDKIPELGDVIAETGKLLRMPGQSRNYGRWTKKESVGRQTLEQYIADFRDMMAVHVDADVLPQVNVNLAILESAANADVVWDEIVDLTYLEDPKEFVYDFTVPGNDSFMVDDNILVHNTLNTFHLAGVAAKSNVTRGVPRLKELLKATRNPKAVELTIPLRRDLRNKKEEARRVSQELEFTLLQDLVTTARIYYDPRDDATLIAEDADWLAFMVAYEKASQPAPVVQQVDPLTESEYETPEASKKSPWILRFELDRERMFAKSITMDDIAYVLKSKFSADLTTIYTDYNSQNLVFRIRLATDQKNPVDDLNTLKTLQNKVLTGTAIRGIPGLRSVNYQKVSDFVELQDGKYAPVDQYILSSDGSNFLDVLCHPDVDPTRVISSNVHDIYENLGIEATRAILYKEMSTLFEESGTNVNYRHVGLLVDKMCTKGKLMSIDRYGINKNDIGPLAKMSFEQTEDIALRAAQFGERDPVLGVSANVMLGAPIRAGTAFTEILLDEAAAVELANTTPEQTFTIHPSAGPQAYSMEDIDNALYGEDNTECATSRIRLDVALPPAMETIPEEIPDVDIAVLEV
jgi:DNA-directed RNA polymerase subunit A"